MKLEDYKMCDYCNKPKLKTSFKELTLNRHICGDCLKEYETNVGEPKINIMRELYLDDHGLYDWNHGIFLGRRCDEEKILEIYLHEYHHHVLRKIGGLVSCSTWDNMSPEGLIEREILSYDS